MSFTTEWYSNAMRQAGTPIELTPDQERCLDTLCSIDAIYNLDVPRPIPGGGVFVYPWYVSCIYRGALSTFDNNKLTRLVTTAHENCVRVEISPLRPLLVEPVRMSLIRDYLRYEAMDVLDVEKLDDEEIGQWMNWMEITLHPRDREATSTFRRHPTLGELCVA